MSERPRLSRALVESGALSSTESVSIPDPALLALPERAIQFGTGALLRGLVDAIIDTANRRGTFNGRVVAVGSTASGRSDALREQDALFTLVVQGVAADGPRTEARVISSLSRALSAPTEWDAVLECARDPELRVIFSNTTEIGITLDETDRFDHVPPASFPGKLTRFLYERGRAFDFDPAAGVVVLPCELIERNGDRLREIVLTLATRWQLGVDFTRWIASAVSFCNTLVDRIVPGVPKGDDAVQLERTLGYRDEMITTCEPYHLFAIEGDEALRARLGFADEPGMIVAPNIGPYRERKVRLLNGTHTIMVPTALLSGCETVRGAMEHETIGAFIRSVLLDEIVPSVDVPGAEAFARDVLDRFANPYVHHALIDITLQQTMKMRVRVIPSMVEHVQRYGTLPRSLVFGFAGYLEYMRGEMQEARRGGGLTVPDDEQGRSIRARWNSVDGSPGSIGALVRDVCGDMTLWSYDLRSIPGFTDAVAEQLLRIHELGALAALDAHLSEARTCQ